MLKLSKLFNYLKLESKVIEKHEETQAKLLASLCVAFNVNDRMTFLSRRTPIDSDSSEPHDTIMILITGTAKDKAKEALGAVQSNSATTDQKNAITLLRMSISEFAKKLPDENATLSLGYEKSADQYDLIAKSSKQKDIIPVGEIIVE